MLDYNSRLLPMRNKGLCGDTEYRETTEALRTKVQDLASLIRESKMCIIFTGAGISTSSGIPDFRGPNGVWTKELKGVKLKKEEKSAELFNRARPSFSHYAVASLVEMNLVHHVISQNVDGLHLRSGVPSSKLSELHGNICMEICDVCKTQYFHDRDIGGMGLRPTGRICSQPGCQGTLRDFAVDWDTELPQDIFRHARRLMRDADLCICVGTSLRIRPAGNMPHAVTQPNKSRPQKGKLSIVNLQETHLDKKCSVRIFHECDEVFRLLCEELAVFVDTNRPLVNSAIYPPRAIILESTSSRSSTNSSDNGKRSRKRRRIDGQDETGAVRDESQSGQLVCAPTESCIYIDEEDEEDDTPK